MATTSDSIRKFLDTPTGDGFYDATYGDWIAGVLTDIYEEGEAFSGKRPRADSGWHWPLMRDLIVADPDVGDAEAYGRYRASGINDWEEYDALIDEVDDSINRSKASEAWAAVVAYVTNG